MSVNNNNHLCVFCLTTTKQNIKCGTCGQPTVGISYRARVPSKTAGKKEWQQLFKEFPHILSVAPRSKKLVDMGIQE